MRIAFLVNQDLHANFALNLLRDTLAGHEVSIFLTEKVGGPVPAIAELGILRALEKDLPVGVVWSLADAAHRPEEATYRTFRQLAAELGGSCEFFTKPNAPEGLERMQRFAPDLAVSIRYGRILQAPFLEIPRLGVLNLHSGLLPRYRGMLATIHALAAGAETIGSTLHWIMDGTIDTGPIVGIARVPACVGLSVLDHILSVYPPGIEMLGDAIRSLAQGVSIAAIPQDEAEADYLRFPDPEDFIVLAQRGFPLYDPARYVSFLKRWVPGESAA